MNESHLTMKAKEAGFCQRNRKMSPKQFLEILLCKVFSAKQQSLTDHIVDLQLTRDVEIRKQSLHEKFNEQAVAFIKSLVSYQISRRIALPSTYLKMFSAILIQDSTRFGLPESLSKDYPGFGGRGAKAGAKIDFVYDLKTHQIHHHSLRAMTENDLINAKNNDWITEGALILRDLGYYSHQGLHEIINKKAFFISKVKPKTALFETTGERLNLVSILKKMNRYGIICMEKEIRIGGENSLKARAIISVVPDHVKKRRKESVLDKAKRQHYCVQKEYHIWENFNVFITNVDRQSLSLDQIMMLYRLRKL